MENYAFELGAYILELYVDAKHEYLFCNQSYFQFFGVQLNMYVRDIMNPEKCTESIFLIDSKERIEDLRPIRQTKNLCRTDIGGDGCAIKFLGRVK